MSSIDDLSQISGISNISRISRANSSAQHRFDSTNLSEWQSMCRNLLQKSITADSQKTDSRRVSDSTKLGKALGSCEESSSDYAKLKLISDCLTEIVVIKSNGIEKDTLTKLQELLKIHRVKKYVHLPNTSKEVTEEITMLGLCDLPKFEFSYEEQLAIKSCLEAKLREKIHSFIGVYENSVGSTKDLLKNNESMLRSQFQQKADMENVHWKDKIDEVCMEYQRDLRICKKMLNEWNDLKLKMNQKNTKDAENLFLQAQIAELKAIITKLSCTIRMYKETPVTVNAFKILNSSLDDRIASIDEEVAQQIELKKAYDALRSTEYDEILRKYLELSHIIQKKKKLLYQL